VARETNYFYKTKFGESLSRVALKYYGTFEVWPQIYSFNKAVIGPDPNRVAPGTELWMPPLLNDRLISKNELQIKGAISVTGTPTTAPQTKAFIDKLALRGQSPQNKLFILGGASLVLLAFLL